MKILILIVLFFVSCTRTVYVVYVPESSKFITPHRMQQPMSNDLVYRYSDDRLKMPYIGDGLFPPEYAKELRYYPTPRNFGLSDSTKLLSICCDNGTQIDSILGIYGIKIK